jgi:sec-independent protein translocase protein TatA
MLFNELRPWHLIILVVVFLALFGYKKLPDATRSVGRSLRIFKSEMKGMHDDESDATPENASTDSAPKQQAVIEGQPVQSAPRATESTSVTPPTSGS